jgi:4-diphosphocytidyl-2-C-methyl-D-erythritol kinase
VNRMVAPAKLTLSLAVTGVRPDGYHELRAEMVSLSLSDVLTFTEGGSGLSIEAEPGTRAEAIGDDGDNLITRALAAVGRRAAVCVVKRIPVGGGLGGGSTDAAAVLRWARCSDPDVALGLGSDVPFSVIGGRALVEGTGERVTPLAFEARRFLLLIPPFGVDTARVYRAWDELEGAREREEGANALTAAALTVEPRLIRWRDALEELTGRPALLAGSGSTWFVEGGPPDGGAGESLGAGKPLWLADHDERARLVAVHTVPAGWDGE